MTSGAGEKTFSVAIIGIGAIAELIALALAEIPRVRLVAGSCRTEAKGRRFADKFNCKWFDDTPRDEMRKQLLAEVNRSLAERVVPGAAEAVRSDEAAAA